MSPRVNFRIFELEYRGSNIVVFRVESARIQPVKFKSTEHIRVGSYKKKLSDYPEKERRLWSITSSTPFEEVPAEKSLTSEDILSRLDYPNFFDLLELPLPDNRDGIINRFLEEGMIVKEGACYSITNLGAILFAKDLSNFPSLSRKMLRIIIYNGKDRLNAKIERVVKKGYAVSFEETIEWINDQIPSNEIIQDALRHENKMYPKVAIREIVANALIHQDFSISGSGPMVEIFDTRMEISNPGKPIIELSRFIDHPPESRNEILASFMRRINICEERGSGIDRAINQIESFQLPAPEFQEEKDFMRVTLFGYRILADLSHDDRIRACYQHCCLRLVSRDYMTNSSLRERFGIDKKSYTMVSRIIRDTMEKGYIKLANPDSKSNRNKKYIPFWA